MMRNSHRNLRFPHLPFSRNKRVPEELRTFLVKGTVPTKSNIQSKIRLRFCVKGSDEFVFRVDLMISMFDMLLIV